MKRIRVKLQRRNRYFYCRYSFNGKEIKESTGTTDIDKADRIRAVIEARLNNDETPVYDNDMFFRELIVEYIDNYAKVYLEERTWKDYVSKSRFALPYFGSKPIKVISSIDIEKFLRQIQKDRNLKKSSLNRYLALISGVFTYAVKRKYLKDNPARDVQRFKESDASKDFKCFNNAEIVKILDACNTRFRVFVMTAIYTGLRRGELIGLQWQDIDFDNNTITVARSYDTVPKSKKARIVGLHPELKQQLMARKSLNNGSIYVFPGKTGGMLVDFRKQWRSTLERAGVRYLNFHVLRHTFATKFLTSGNSEASLRELLGHKSFQTTKRYSHLASEHEYIKQAINRIDFNGG